MLTWIKYLRTYSHVDYLFIYQWYIIDS